MRPHWLRQTIKRKFVNITLKYTEKEKIKRKEIEMPTTPRPTFALRVNDLTSDEWLTSPSIILAQSLCLEICASFNIE
jgi:hypothetical protein